MDTPLFTGVKLLAMMSLDQIAQILIKPDSPLLDALKQLNANAGGALAVIGENGELLGTLTDGDIRRALLNSHALTDEVSCAMRAKPLFAYFDSGFQERSELMHRRNISFLPIVDKGGKLCGAEIHGLSTENKKLPNYAVVMCGGLGSRLGALTRNCPKPMLRIGGLPILERIVRNLIGHGVTRFFFATNYLREQIEDYFGDGAKWNVEISYLRENKRLGTGGALSLLPFIPDDPIIIMNGDLLTDTDFGNFLDFHYKNKAIATMGIVEFSYQNPYGVIRYDQSTLIGIEEKPIQSWYINSGIYIINPEILGYIPEDTYIDMPSILMQAMNKGKRVNVYPIYENWLDIGREDDFNLAQTLI